jgi:hypothetical protein
MDVRDIVLRLARGATLRDGISLVDVTAAPHEKPADVRQRRLVPVGRLDRDRQAVRRNLPGEGHLP